jgi:putative PIN family toxin of toxin-antitoxin system
MMKILIDTNVWISGLLWGGKARDVINLARQNKIIIYVSSLLLNELEETLSYPKLQRRLRQLGVTRVVLMEEVRNLTLLCQPTPLLSISELRDPKDKIVLETALTIPVDVIISGDKDLLILQEFQKIPILMIAQFLEFYEG